MTKNGLLLGALLASSSLLAATGCGDDENKNTSSTSTTTSSSSGMGGMGTGGTGTGGTGTGGTGTGGTGTGGTGGGSSNLSCESYCTQIMDACQGENAQYNSMASCLGTCSHFDVGSDGDTKEPTLGCRIYHAGVAAMPNNAKDHCPHAGPSGGGSCGTPCEAFCKVALGACTGNNVQYATADECNTECAKFTADPANTYDAADTSGDTFNCRMYHLTVAATDDTSASAHCSHIPAGSPVCM
jgi:hypothetical protein